MAHVVLLRVLEVNTKWGPLELYNTTCGLKAETATRRVMSARRMLHGDPERGLTVLGRTEQGQASFLCATQSRLQVKTQMTCPVILCLQFSGRCCLQTNKTIEDKTRQDGATVPSQSMRPVGPTEWVWSSSIIGSWFRIKTLETFDGAILEDWRRCSREDAGPAFLMKRDHLEKNLTAQSNAPLTLSCAFWTCRCSCAWKAL